MFSKSDIQLPTGSKRTKIVCTIGPKSSPLPMMRQLVYAGADVFRLNFSHGSHDQHRQAVLQIRDISSEVGRPVGIMADISGPKLRVGPVVGEGVALKQGDRVVLTPDAADGTDNIFQITFEGLADVAKAGDTILLDDGALRFEVAGLEGNRVVCTVAEGGVLKSRKGVNLPNIALPIPAMTEKDEADLAFALSVGVDLVALSFVRQAADILQAKEFMKRCGRVVPLFAKIEKAEALKELEAILNVADGAMVARGDLGIEIPMERVPYAQKRIIRYCNRIARPVITATQMLDSMIRNARPTRAEVTDVYNAILDGTDAVMLSGETAMGDYPSEAVDMMVKIAIEAERVEEGSRRDLEWLLGPGERPSTPQAVSHGAVQIAHELGVDAIIAPTKTGTSAMRVSRFRPQCPVYALSTDSHTVNRLTVSWGVTPRHLESPPWGDFTNNDEIVKASLHTLKRAGLIHPGQKVIILSGSPVGEAGKTNNIQVLTVT